MNRSIPIAVICGWAALFGADQAALGQAGSTGGTIGKTDKSASGGEGDQIARTRKPETKSTKAAGACAKVAGTYSYSPDGTVVVFKSDRTTSHSGGPRGTWTCAGGVVTVVWNTGFIDHLTPTEGGFSASNNIGVTWVAKRM
jgi:hypothetical protein